MALSTIGFGYDDARGDIGDVKMAQLQWAAQTADSFEGVISGFVARPSTTTPRTVVLSGPGIAYACFVRADADADMSITHDAVTSGTRLDTAVLQFDWSNKTVSLAAVKGSASSAPALTRTPGGLWQMPLYSTPVTPSTGLFAAGDLIPRKPIPRRPRIFRAADWVSKRIPASAPGGTDITTLAFGDPGWPYLLRIVARQSFDQGDETGTATLAVLNGGTELARNNGDTWPADTPSGNPAGPIHESIQVIHTTDVMSGQGVLHLVGIPRAISPAGYITAEAAGSNTLYAEQMPA